MKTKVQLYQVPPGSDMPEIPASLFAAKEVVLYHLTAYMRMFGIGRITVTPVGVGLKTITNVAFKPLKGEPPEEYVKARNFMLRNLADSMSLFGILDIEIQPSEEEMVIIEASWEAFKSGEVQDIKLNLDEDPTSESVLTEE